jgi:hypothetical protein
MTKISHSLRRGLDNIFVAFAWRYACHALMLLLALLNETRPAPSLPDSILSVIPRIEWVHRWNYHLWLLLYLPVALWLWRKSRPAFLHFLYVGGALSLLRGICIPLTGLGPVHGPDVNVGKPAAELITAWLALINPISALTGNAPSIYLTKDLFFSGHTATTFLLWLYCRGRGPIGRVGLLAHVLVVVVVFTAHLHYTIDVVGAWFITYGLFAAATKRWPVIGQRPTLDP